MKKLIFLVILVFTVWAISAQELSLDGAINRASKDIEEELSQRSMVLLLNIVSPSTAFSEYVLNELTDQLVMGRKVNVVDRRNLTAIREEMNFQYSGEVSDESMVSIGKMLGAHYIVTGSLDDRGTSYRLRIRIVVVETTRIHSSIIIDLKKDTQIAYLIGGEQAVRQQEEAERIGLRSGKAANSRNNWISGEALAIASPFYGAAFIGGWGLGLKYERMLNKHISLAGNLYFGTQDFSLYNQYGIDLLFRFYPVGKSFYLGAGVGYASLSGAEPYSNYYFDGKRDTFTFDGFAINIELGWKIDIGNTGGFFLTAGTLGSVVLGESSFGPWAEDDEGGGIGMVNADFRIFLGMGYAF